MKKIIQLDSVDTYNQLYGLETLHPLVSVVDLRKATKSVNHIEMNYGLYALFLKNGKGCEITYGRRKYDYQRGTIVSFAPGQVVEVQTAETEFQPDALGLLFHPDLIRGTSLGQKIKAYTFFSYTSNEALHLSERERAVVEECLEQIRAETEHPIDKHSRGLIATNIELLLNYCLRYYERQFTTREAVNEDVLARFERELESYYDTLNGSEGLPNVKYFADKVHLSANYFGDLVKRQTGKSPQEYIQYWLIERAKTLIVTTDLTMSEIAYQLGFTYPQHFGRLFKKQTGTTPQQFRGLA